MKYGVMRLFVLTLVEVLLACRYQWKKGNCFINHLILNKQFYFSGWLHNLFEYDFSKPASGNMMLTARQKPIDVYYFIFRDEIWTKEIGTPLFFQLAKNATINSKTTNLIDAQVDRKSLKESEYNPDKNSELLGTLKVIFLETLSIGRHTFRIRFEDGSADTYFMMISADLNPRNLSQTGDNIMHPVVDGGMAILSLTLFGYKLRDLFS